MPHRKAPRVSEPYSIAENLQDSDGTFGQFEIKDGFIVERKEGSAPHRLDWLMLNGLGKLILEILAKHRESITDAVKGSPMFAFVLSDVKPEEDKQTAQLVAKISNYPIVESALMELAVKLTSILKASNEIPEDADEAKVIHTIMLGMNNAIRTKLEETERAEIILTRVNTLEEDTFVSPYKIKQIVREIKEKKLSDEESIAQLIEEIDLIEGFGKMSESEKLDVLRDVDKAVHDARELFKRMLDSLVDVITGMIDSGEISDEEVVFPELNDKILSHSAFKLLGNFFNGSIDRNPRDFNDIQSILILAYALFKYRRHPIVRQALKEHGPFTETLTSEPFFERSQDPAYSKIYRYNKGEYREASTKRKEETGFITIGEGTDTEKKVRVKIDGTNVKEAESILFKAYGRKGNVEVGTMTDILRGRFVLWDIDLKNFQSNIEDIRALARKAGERLGLTYHDTDRENLKSGQFRLEEPDEDELFKKFTLHGISASGVPLEVQFIPKDVYELRTAKSPLDHKAYKKGKQVEVGLAFIPYSVSPIAHRTGKAWLERNADDRESAKAAMKSLTE